MNKVGIKNLAYSLGDSTLIKDINGIHLTELSQDRYREINGLKNYLKTEKTLYELALDTAKKTLDDTTIMKDHIGAVFFATASYYSEEITNQDFGSKLLNDLGLKKSFFYGVFMQYCSTIASAFRLAKNYLINENVESVLVISADKVYGDYGFNRISTTYVHSDAAVSFLVSRENMDYLVMEFSECQDAELWDCIEGKNEKRDKLLNNFVLNTKSVFEKCLEKNQIKKDQIYCVLYNNYNKTILKYMSAIWDIPYELFYDKNLSKTAHCPAGDIFINLIDMENDGLISPDANIFAFFAAPHSWTATILKKLSKQIE